MTEVCGDTSDDDAFHDVNSILYTVQPTAGILSKIIYAFLSENLALFTLTSFTASEPKTYKKNINSRNGTENKMESNRNLKTQKGQMT